MKEKRKITNVEKKAKRDFKIAGEKLFDRLYDKDNIFIFTDIDNEDEITVQMSFRNMSVGFSVPTKKFRQLATALMEVSKKLDGN